MAGNTGSKMDGAREAVIFDAAFTVFTRYGFQRCTMDDIAREAGMSRPALYQYFRNKKAIYRALVGRLVDDMVHGIEAGLQQAGPAADVLFNAYETAVLAPLADIKQTPHGPELVSMGGDLADDLMADLFVRKHAVLTAFFHQRMGAGEAQKAADLADLTIDAFEGAKARCADMNALREAFGRSVRLIAAASEG